MKSQKCAAGFENQLPPDETHVRVYFLQQGSTAKHAANFIDHYKAKGWRNSDGRQLKKLEKARLDMDILQMIGKKS
jgi:hypothetical protein